MACAGMGGASALRPVPTEKGIAMCEASAASRLQVQYVDCSQHKTCRKLFDYTLQIITSVFDLAVLQIPHV